MTSPLARSGEQIWARIGVLLAALWIPSQGHAAQSISAEASCRYFHYREYRDDAQVLNTEKGFVPGIGLSWAVREDRLNLEAGISLHSGDVDYEGRTNTGLPLSTKTAAEFASAHLALERMVARAGSWQSGLSLAYAGRQWQRDIKASRTATGVPVSSLHERYRWQVISIALLLDWRDERASVETAVAATHTLDPKVRVEFPSQWDAVTLKQRARPGATAMLRWRYAVTHSVALQVELEGEYYRFGRSADQVLTRNGVAVGTIFEPGSETWNATFGLALEGRFR